MMYRITVVLLVVALTLVTVDAMADEVASCATPVTLDLGTFLAANGSYAAWTAEVNWGPWRLYEEMDTRSPYDLTIASYRYNDKGDRAVVRIDDGDVRVGPFVTLPAGFSARALVGEGPERLDVWTPCAKVAQSGKFNAGVYGWFRTQDGSKPDFWVCPGVSYGSLSIEFEYNLDRNGAGDFWFANWRAITWP